MINWYKMNDFERLQTLIGQEFDIDEIICAMIDKDEYVLVNKSQNKGYDYIAYYDYYQSNQYLFTLDNNIIVDIKEILK